MRSYSAVLLRKQQMTARAVARKGSSKTLAGEEQLTPPTLTHLQFACIFTDYLVDTKTRKYDTLPNNQHLFLSPPVRGSRGSFYENVVRWLQ